MSYIEREPLIKILNGLYNHHLTMRNYAADGATFDCISAVIEAPTADVVEVRHGEWKHNEGGGYVCSECNCWLEDYYGAKPEMMKYCFKCGAKMDGERREE